jgi:hypothetical protein
MNCKNCDHEFAENEGRFNHSDGMLCQKCEDNIDDINLPIHEETLQKKYSTSFLEKQQLGKYTIDGDLLQKYVDLDSNLKFFTTIALGTPDMGIVCNIMRGKESLLRQLFASVNLSYTLMGTDTDAQKFLQLVDDWTKNTIKCTAQ